MGNETNSVKNLLTSREFRNNLLQSIVSYTYTSKSYGYTTIGISAGERGDDFSFEEVSDKMSGLNSSDRFDSLVDIIFRPKDSLLIPDDDLLSQVFRRRTQIKKSCGYDCLPLTLQLVRNTRIDSGKVFDIFEGIDSDKVFDIFEGILTQEKGRDEYDDNTPVVSFADTYIKHPFYEAYRGTLPTIYQPKPEEYNPLVTRIINDSSELAASYLRYERNVLTDPFVLTDESDLDKFKLKPLETIAA